MAEAATGVAVGAVLEAEVAALAVGELDANDH